MIHLLLAQDLTQLPEPTNAQSWWPVAMALLSLLVGGASTAFAAYVKIKEKYVERVADQQAAATQIELEQLKLQFEQRKLTMDSLSSEFKFALAESRKLREELKQAREAIHDRDQIIAELRGTTEAMKARITHLESLIK